MAERGISFIDTTSTDFLYFSYPHPLNFPRASGERIVAEIQRLNYHQLQLLYSPVFCPRLRRAQGVNVLADLNEYSPMSLPGELLQEGESMSKEKHRNLFESAIWRAEIY